MKTGEQNRRLRAKAISLLDQTSLPPYFTTTQALLLLEAGCRAAKFHRLLVNRGLAIPSTGFDKGHEFSLPAEYGSASLSIKNHHSFRWSAKGIHFISSILADEGIAFTIPDNLHRWL